ncbi:MAG: GTPase Era, partial [Pseudomonadota bacterium]
MTASEATPRRCGFIAVLGATNVGKSTLVNRLVGAKVSIVSPKVQTTRARIAGIAMDGPVQMVFLDTPGIFAPRRRLDRAMVDAAWRSAAEADLALLLVDAKRGLDEATLAIIDALAARAIAAALVLNKIDLVRSATLLGLAKQANDRGGFAATFMVSAESGDGVKDLKAWIAARVPAGPWHYPEDEISDLPARLLAAEITR